MSVKDQIYLFYGEDASALHLKLGAWVTRFAVASDMALDRIEIDGETASIDHIQQELQLMPLLGPKRLVVIRQASGQSKANQERIVAMLPAVPDQTIVVFVEEGKRSSGALMQALLDNYRQYYFGVPSPLVLRQRVTRHFVDQGLTIEPRALQELLERTQGDTTRLDQELVKLSLAASDQSITIELVEALVSQPLQSRIFALCDAILAQHHQQAYRLMENELNFGTAPLQIIGLLISQLRKMMAIRDALDRRLTGNSRGILHDLKPAAVAALTPKATRYTTAQLARYALRLSMADMMLKSGLDPESVMNGLVRFSDAPVSS